MRTNSKQVQSKPPTTTSKPASKPASKGPSQVQSKKSRGAKSHYEIRWK